MSLRSPRQEKVAPLTIIGAGPAGLAAGIACQHAGVDFNIVELGKPLAARKHGDPADLALGTGGAGLYSDGKFSFFPSATQLWSLKPRADLDSSYEWLSLEMAKVGLKASQVPTAQEVELLQSRPSEQFQQKSYQSVYGSFAQRATFIQSLESALAGRIWTNTAVTAFAESEHGYRLTLLRPDGNEEPCDTNALLLATGRFGPLLVHRSASIPKIFRRLEVGVRIEQPKDSFFLAAHTQVDPKLIFSDDANGTEYRTFCCCRDGEIVAVEHSGINTLSGRSDIVPTGRSNVGFLVRVLDEARSVKLWSEMLDRLRIHTVLSNMSLDALLAEVSLEGTPIERQFGLEMAKLIVAGLKRLRAHVGASLLSNAVIHFPALEGFVEYPAIDDALRIPGTCIWAAGDVSGRFRGLVAALVSGYFAGLQISKEMRRGR